MKPRTSRLSSMAAFALASACFAVPAAALGQSEIAAIIAAQIRSQGFVCSNPSAAERIAAESAPNKPAYLLKCEASTYRVVLIPDQAAIVTRVE
jgi:hypothetical protein